MVRVAQRGPAFFNPSSIAVHTLLIVIVSLWLAKVTAILPEPYLDEVFHVRQAQAYWKHQWQVWDPKITTPPGLYLISYLFYSVVQFCHSVRYDGQALRVLNAILFCLVVPNQVRKLLQLRRCQPPPDKDTQLGERTEVGDESSKPSLKEINHIVLNICLFPPLFFFSVLYYTDVLSAICVLATYIVFLQRRQTTINPSRGSQRQDTGLHACYSDVPVAQRAWASKIELCVLGLCALLFRQTNIFWVAVFLPGLEIIQTVKRDQFTSWDVDDTSFSGMITNCWYHGKIYDPLVREACIEDYFKTAISLAVAATANLSVVLASITPYIFLLLAFGVFVSWNGGVVLGHKEFHTASIHLPQMLYIWPNFVFFSFPLIYPYLLNSVVPQNILPNFLRRGSTRHRLPRPNVSIVILGLMILTVRYNTIVHPFTLADNRHYVFYVFRILLRHPSIKYLAVPVYFLCAWAGIQALGGIPDGDENVSPVSSKQTLKPAKSKENTPDEKVTTSRPSHQPTHLNDRSNNAPPTTPPNSTHPPHPNPHGIRTSFVLVYLLTTTLSLITAPLVEPRYFIIPWLVWRLHVPVLTPPPQSAQTTNPRNASTAHTTTNRPLVWLDSIRDVAYRKHDHRLWLETVWFLLINCATCYVFLYWGFEWPAEEERGKVQRFMW